MLVQVKAKGVEGLIPVENPNRVAAKAIKAKNVDVNAQVTLSRRERYAILVPASVRVSVRVSTCVCVCVWGGVGVCVCVCVGGCGCVCVCPHVCVDCVTYREEIEKQRAAESYRKLHEAGKTDEARRDLARLAIIRQQREDAAKRRETDRKGDLSVYSNRHLLPPPLQLKKLQQQGKNELLLCY